MYRYANVTKKLCVCAPEKQKKEKKKRCPRKSKINVPVQNSNLKKNGTVPSNVCIISACSPTTPRWSWCVRAVGEDVQQPPHSAVITLGFGPRRGKLCLVVICQPGTLANSTGHSQKRQPGRCIQSFGSHHPPNTRKLYPNISFADTPQKKNFFFIKIKK